MTTTSTLAADVTVICDTIAHISGTRASIGATRTSLEAVNGVSYAPGTRFGRALDAAVDQGRVIRAAGDQYIAATPGATPADNAAAIARVADLLRASAAWVGGLNLGGDYGRRRATEYRLRAAELDGHTHGLYEGARLLATYPSAAAAQSDLEVERGDAVAEQRDPKVYRVEPLGL